MPYSVETSHKIVAFGNDRMDLFDSKTGSVIVTAVRSGTKWTVSVQLPATGIEDVLADARPEAITTMGELALQAVPNTGISTIVPHGLADMP